MKKIASMVLCLVLISGILPCNSVIIHADADVTPETQQSMFAPINPLESGGTSDTVSYVFDSEDNVSQLITGDGASFICGDINDDGHLNARDILRMRLHLAGRPVEFDERRADINGDGSVNAADMISQKLVLAGIVSRSLGYENEPCGVGITYDNTDGAALITVSDAADKLRATLPVADSASGYSYMVMTYKSDASNSSSADSTTVYTKSGEHMSGGSTHMNEKGKYTSRIIPLEGDTDSIALDVFGSAENGDRLYLDSIALCSDRTGAEQFASQREVIRNGIGGEEAGLTVEPDDCLTVRLDSSEAVADYISSPYHASFAYNTSDSALRLTVASERVDPSVFFNASSLGISADEYKYVVYTYRIPTSNQKVNPLSELFFCSGDVTGATSGYSRLFSVAKNDAFCSEIINLAGESYWAGNINGIRIDFFADAFAGDSLNLYAISFCKNVNAAKFTSLGLLTEANGGNRVGTPATDTQNVWESYKAYATTDSSSGEYFSFDGDTPVLNIFAGTASRLDKSKLEARIAESIQHTNGAGVTVEIIDGFADIARQYNEDENARAGLSLKISNGENCYVAHIDTVVKARYIIFDHDLGSDCDDAGAIAMLIKAHRDGYCHVLAITGAVYNHYASSVVGLVCEYFGVDDIEIGVNRERSALPGSTWYRSTRDACVKYYENKGRAYPSYESNVPLLRRLIAQTEGDITVVTTGPVTTIYALLRSSADSNSSLTGAELFRSKVTRYICGGGNFPNGTSENNLMCDPEASQGVLNHYLASYPIIFVGAEVAGVVRSGGVLRKYNDYVLRDCYEAVAGSDCDHNSWDLGVIHYSVFGGSGYWALRSGTYTVRSYGNDGCITIQNGGINRYLCRIGSTTEIGLMFNESMVP